MLVLIVIGFLDLMFVLRNLELNFILYFSLYFIRYFLAQSHLFLLLFFHDRKRESHLVCMVDFLFQIFCTVFSESFIQLHFLKIVIKSFIFKEIKC